jgi:Ca2+-binding RTX toxin-like protein
MLSIAGAALALSTLTPASPARATTGDFPELELLTDCFDNVVVPTTLFVPAGGALFAGTPGNDLIIGTDGPDQIDGRGGNDRICGQRGADEIWGGEDFDVIDGERGDDTLEGRPRIRSVYLE